jgi:hypothetical protein
VFESESALLRRAALAFLAMERQAAGSGDRGEWRDFEVRFGSRNGGAAARFEITPGRAISVQGRIDRVDELPGAGLRVVDYKTGGTYAFKKNPKSGPFNGGRQLQAAIYAAVSTTVLGTPVTAFEYRFPTEKGNGEIISYDRAELAAANGIIASLLEQVDRGTFVPTDDHSDCTYCEYGAICRVKHSEYGATSPRAAWAKEHGPALDVYQVMRRLRSSANGDGNGAGE